MQSTFPLDSLLMYYVFSFLEGDDLFHRISILNKKIRETLPKAGLLTQIKIVTCKELHAFRNIEIALNSFEYALKITNGLLLKI